MNFCKLLLAVACLAVFTTANATPPIRPMDGSVIKVIVTGGPNAGTYNLTSAETTCSRNATGANSFGNQYSTRAATGLTSVQLIIGDAKKAASGSTSDCYLSIRFGKLIGGTKYEFGKLPASFGGEDTGGKGTAGLSGSGNTTTSTIEGTTKSGVKIQVTIQCRSVLDLGNKLNQN
ncbi:hypothetical protein GO730_23580 [Spirosoma sp. HMF3257]|uniref:Uncharacterized protein n=1 Tax=Spirosoma telluris TaxID=2183553 RepID=A0A327NM28_9BACT|nr:hypothetical protein [Spirosoma telluris]RAI76390.1 hypothetical protein HMF3257_23510 [Spirosoma telluris]